MLKISDKELTVAISYEKIQKRVSELAEQISNDLKDQRPLIIGVLNGAFIFVADLTRKITIDCEVSFLRVSSYNGTTSSGIIKNTIGLTSEIKDRTIVLVEDIIDTGGTIAHLIEEMQKQHPRQIHVATLLLKPSILKHNIKIAYVGFEMPDDFLVGYGLDYNGSGRTLTNL